MLSVIITTIVFVPTSAIVVELINNLSKFVEIVIKEGSAAYPFSMTLNILKLLLYVL
jgi:hypothetical protein